MSDTNPQSPDAPKPSVAEIAKLRQVMADLAAKTATGAWQEKLIPGHIRPATEREPEMIGSFGQGLAAFAKNWLAPEALVGALVSVAEVALFEIFNKTGKALGLTSSSNTELDFRASPDIIAAVQLALDTLIAELPRKSGFYRRSFYIVSDGVFYPPGSWAADAVTDRTQVVIIGDSQPQNRRVDVQLNGSRPLKFSVPAGMYQAAVDAVNQRYGNSTEAKRLYDYKNFSGRYVQKHQGYTFQTPAVQITARG